ncbi:MAG: hypothetical protein DMF61_09340 [Blastocatellia bacterium AA13]|nr:MAG: hypothetical protein DMF61_09340 [Blastocatellia bacterium AA13]
MKPDLTDLISQAQAARIRGCSHEAIRDLIKRGKLKSFEIGDRVFVLQSEVERFKPGKPGPRKIPKKSKKPKTT